MQTRAHSCMEGRWRLQAACMSQQPWDDSDSQETAAVSSLMPAFHHPECLFLQECQEMHGEFTGSACGHHGPYTPDVLFWSCILFFTTFILSSTLKTFKTSRYFPTRVGSTLLHFFCVRLQISQNRSQPPCCLGVHRQVQSSRDLILEAVAFSSSCVQQPLS